MINHLFNSFVVAMSVAAPVMKDELGWSEAQRGYALSSFYWGYALGQLPASQLASYYGAKNIFGLQIFLSSIFSFAVPELSRLSYSGILLCRVIIGLSASGCFPSVYHFFKKWVPPEEKTSLIPFVMLGMYFGEIIGFSLSGVLINIPFTVNNVKLGGWALIFYFFSIAGFLWLPLWFYMISETPFEHPCISEEELALYNAGGNPLPLLFLTLPKQGTPAD
jgi:MFS family permease